MTSEELLVFLKENKIRHKVKRTYTNIYGTVKFIKKDITSIPAGFRFFGGLVLTGCTSLKYLPSGLIVQKYLNITNCSLHLPEDLSVSGLLFWDGCELYGEVPQGVLNNKKCTLIGEVKIPPNSKRFIMED